MFLAKGLAWTLLALSVHAKAPADCGGKPRQFELTITWEQHAPDGFSRNMMLVNGQFPGPPLEIIQGDRGEVLTLLLVLCI
jgi:hypothetical protein